MRKILFLFAGTLVSGSLLAGGLVTNTNQSALYTRLQSRNASTSVDAVYYNPAGLGKLGSGFYASVSNQTIGQTRSILNNYSYLTGTPKEYIGTVSAPLFPSVYAAFKTGKLAFSLGVNPIGGGGGAAYEDGLPSFEMPISELVPLTFANGFGTTAYSTDIYFKGSSTYFGFQANVTYAINNMISVAAGIRMVTAKNTYSGYMRDISINPNYPAFGTKYNGSMNLASDFFTDGSTTMTALATGATAYVAGLQPIITGGGGSVLLSNGTIVGLTSAQITQIQTIMGAAGQTTAQIGGATIAYAQAVLGAAAPVFTATSATLGGYAAATQDVEVEAEQTGFGYSPVVSVNISPIDMLNIAIKYEFKTKLELTTSLIDNKGGGVFTEGQKTIADMPALLAAGIEFKPIDKLMLTASMEYFFDKDVDYDGSETVNLNMIDKNLMFVSLGGEFKVNDQLRVSAGWGGSFSGVNADYQNDQRFSANTTSFGGGFGYRLMDMLDLNIGGQYTVNKEASKSLTRLTPITETYNKNTWIVAIGLDLYFGL